MGNDTDLKKHFEAILGQELVADVGNEIVLRDYVGVYFRTESGRRSSRDIGTTGSSTKRCGNVGVLTIAGLAVTGREGRVVRLLSDFHCEKFDIARPSILVATPRSGSPVFVTTTTALVQTGGYSDIRMEFATWTPSGNPAPNIAVAWHCITAYQELSGDDVGTPNG
ncbi:MAG: hypothetical protein AB8I58_24155 [Anaerolineales bacterium]|jgi:hypothetical protein